MLYNVLTLYIICFTLSIHIAKSLYLILTLLPPFCYHGGMTKKSTQDDDYDLSTVSFRFAPFQVQQLALMSRFHGSKTRTMVVALDRLYRDMLATNSAFAEMVAAGASPATDDAADSDG